MTISWQFNAMDNLFFRDSRPMTAGESAWIESVFPPTGRTLQGAIRTAIIDYQNIDYKDFSKDPQLQKEIGDSNSMGQLDLTGPWIIKQDKLYYPVPLDLVKNKQNEYALLIPSIEPIKSDLGNTYLPSIKGQGYKTIENHFISEQALQNLLEGKIPKGLKNEIIQCVATSIDDTALADREPKVGLARNNQSRTAREGMLFAIAPIRPRENIRISINIDGLIKDKHPTESFLQRLGGEGKLSHINIQQATLLPQENIQKKEDEIRFKVIFTTNALMPTKGWLPEGFIQVTDERKAEYWQGELNNIAIDIITACIGKPFKQGGWDHINHQARPLLSYVPAGSVYFCKAKPEDEEKIRALHGSKIGKDTEYGFGHILIGKW